MNKKELTDAVSDQMACTKARAAQFVDCVLIVIAEGVASGEKVAIADFGSFERVPRAARTARNPATGEDIAVAATHVVRFRPALRLRELAARRGRGDS